ncbi:LCP family protein [Pseudobutyrivibrio xylanivorans]|uniref:LytR family transcriptional regulator n=1 Tax=Pseudobutyrivibrio xylanivorans TaxID=185007 RepID=A0A5P6VMH6_PSEXY|nr:LCP family protein [Pseudobutyrivibrio xylanivorans]QFJ53767.1 LytR family transcriptional regulator [Pseudobutyrivibrio xylanivorans]
MKNNKREQVILKVLLCACAITIGTLLVVLLRHMMSISILPVLHCVVIVLLILLLFGAGGYFLLHKKTAYRVLGILLIVLSIVGNIEGIYFYLDSEEALKTIANQTTEITSYGVYVLKDSEAESIADLENEIVGVSEDISDKKLAKKLDKYSIITSTYDSPMSSVEGLINEECAGAVLNTSYVEMLEEKDNLRLVNEIKVSKKVEASNVISSEKPFVVYISGKDTWGHISVTSRSDVNIIAVVNPGTKHILLVSTPRDYYVPLSISNGVKDKLTHSGIYGIEVSEATMEMLYGIKMDHYFKLNYSGFEGLIDAMGGITVWSDYAFDVENIGHFKKGDNELSGLEALAFVRERHSFARGDVQRGVNQMNVIQSVVQKLTSKAILKNYGEILRKCDGTFATDLSSEEIADLVSFQLSNPGEWNIEKISVGGTGEYNNVYSLKKSVYVMDPNQDDIDNAKARIQEVLDEI